MAYKPVSLNSLLQDKNRTLFLPHIQRPFVWEFEQVVRFLDSLLKNYPFQTLLFWKTTESIQCRKFMDLHVEDPVLHDYYDPLVSEEGKLKTLVLDGQQRLQSLFFAYAGGFGTKKLYIDLTSGVEEIEHGVSYRFELSQSQLELPWFRIGSLYENKTNANDIADSINDQLDNQLEEESEERKQRERRVRRNVTQLSSILKDSSFIWVDELDATASDEYDYQNVLNIFVRVNSGGTKLEPSDLLFAVMKEAWAPMEENIETIVVDLNSSGRLFFDKTFVLKALMVAIGEGAVLSPKRLSSPAGATILSEIEDKWPTLERAFGQLQDFLQNDLHLYSDKVIRSYNAFIPAYHYFYLNPSTPATAVPKLKAYYYSSQMFNWFSARTDQVLNACSTIVATAPQGQFPLQEFRDYFRRQNRQVQLDGDEIDMRLRYIVLNMIYVEEFGNSPFHVRYRGNEPHIDHIYPKSKLKDLSTSEVNHIGNYRFCGGSENLRKRAQDPADYFEELKQANVDINRHLLVDRYSNDPTQLTFENYEDFRRRRTERVLEICKRVVNA